MPITRYLPRPTMEVLRDFLTAGPRVCGSLYWSPKDSDTKYGATDAYGYITVAQGSRNAQIDSRGMIYGDEEVVEDVLATFHLTPLNLTPSRR